jgi:hypothetical protein
MAVAGNVVAAHDRERHDADVAPALQPGEDEAEHRFRRIEMRRVGAMSGCLGSNRWLAGSM